MTDLQLVKSFWNNVKRALKEKNIPRKAFCPDVGLKEKTLSAMICRSTPPDICLLTRIRDALEVEVTSLLYSFDSDDDRVPLSPKEKKLIELVRHIPADKQAAVIDTVLSVLDCIKSPSSAENTAPPSAGTSPQESTFRRVDLTRNQDPIQPESAPLPPQTRLQNPLHPPRLPSQETAAPQTPGTTVVQASSAGRRRKGSRQLSPEEQVRRWRERATRDGQTLLFDFEEESESTEV